MPGVVRGWVCILCWWFFSLLHFVVVSFALLLLLWLRESEFFSWRGYR